MHPLPLLLALAVTTFATDPAWSIGPVAGLRQLWIDPTTATGALRPADSPPAGEQVRSTEPGALVFTNPTNTWAAIAVDGHPVGEITAYATLRVQTVQPGWHAVTLTLPSGFVRPFAVRVE